MRFTVTRWGWALVLLLLHGVAGADERILDFQARVEVRDEMSRP